HAVLLASGWRCETRMGAAAGDDDGDGGFLTDAGDRGGDADFRRSGDVETGAVLLRRTERGARRTDPRRIAPVPDSPRSAGQRRDRRGDAPGSAKAAVREG